ncbi:MAG: helix-turn-helix domain-containing protein, partial [Albidovulum sp.]
AVASELFRYANEELGQQHYVTVPVSAKPGLVKCSNGTEINATAALGEISEADTIIVCSSVRASGTAPPRELINWLRTQHRLGTPICALGSAVWTIAATGLLDGRACAAHWTEISALRHTYSGIHFSKQMFTTANHVWVCSGGDSVTDMLLHFLGQYHGVELSKRIRRKLILKPSLSGSDPRDTMFHSNASDMELVGERFLEFVEARVDNPQSIAEICEQLLISQRTLNRYCHALFSQSPKEMYLDIRLRQAQHLLLCTDLKVEDVAAGCGFKTPGHFAQIFNRKFGCSPSGFRNARPAPEY